ncbi:MAG: DUF2157 domain-containing protein [Rickettsiales bacterium]|jgi:uncharacterized membrane protein|nr:DUF2157 domain-containing protein [Rickettsiales bacterium]
MGIGKKLSAWTRRGLITKSQAGAIERFEKAEAGKRSIFSSIFLLAGILFVAWGVVSIIAHNWDGIPAAFKLSVGLGAQAALAYGIWRSRGGYLSHEGFVVAYAAMAAANIALVAQIYQLDSDFADGLMVWAALSLPALLVSKGPWLGWAWAGALVWIASDKAYDAAAAVWGFRDGTAANVLAILYASLGLLFVQKHILIEKFGVCGNFSAVAKWWGLALFGMAAFALEFAEPAPIMGRMWPVLAVFALFLAVFWLVTRGTAGKGLRLGSLLAGLAFLWSFAVQFVSVGERGVDSGFVNTLLLLAIAMFYLHGAHRPRLFRLAFDLFALRVFVFLCEKFGTLLFRGFGFVVVGAVFLGVFFIWRAIARGVGIKAGALARKAAKGRKK